MAHCLNCLYEYNGIGNTCPYCGYRRGLPPAANHQIWPGSVLHGRYEIGTVIGSGGFGITYHAWDLYHDMPVAIKEYYPQGTANRAFNSMAIRTCEVGKMSSYSKGIESFLEEGRRLMRFNHVPSIVRVYDFFEENNTAYIIMELLRGENLSDYMLRTGNVASLDMANNIIFSVIESLDEIHKIGMIHRDISPDNIFICSDMTVKLIDFGAARNQPAPNGPVSIVIKPNYAPPEQFNRNGRQGPWTDIYALGATVYRILTGCIPSESVSRVMEDDIKPVSSVNAFVSTELDRIIMKCMALKIEDRYQDVASLRNDILDATKKKEIHF